MEIIKNVIHEIDYIDHSTVLAVAGAITQSLRKEAEDLVDLGGLVGDLGDVCDDFDFHLRLGGPEKVAHVAGSSPGTDDS